jgi:hypothetical protein
MVGSPSSMMSQHTDLAAPDASRRGTDGRTACMSRPLAARTAGVPFVPSLVQFGTCHGGW